MWNAPIAHGFPGEISNWLRPKLLFWSFLHGSSETLPNCFPLRAWARSELSCTLIFFSFKQEESGAFMLERAVRRKTVQRISIPWIHTRDSSQYIFRRIGIVIITVWRSWAAILLARHHILARNSNFRKVSCETAINLWHSATWWTCSSDVWLEHSAASAATTAVPQTLGRGSKGCSVAPGWPTGWEVGKQLLWPHEWHEWYDECMVCHFFRWYHGRPGSGKYHEASWSIMK